MKGSQVNANTCIYIKGNIGKYPIQSLSGINPELENRFRPSCQVNRRIIMEKLKISLRKWKI